MFFRDFLVDYFNGFRASLYGFFVLHKLDAVTIDEKSTVVESASKKSDVKAPSVLQKRRLVNASASRKPAVEELAPQKPTAVWRVCQCILLNVACVIALQFVLLPLFRLVAYLSPFYLPDDWNGEFVSSLFGVVSILPVYIISRAVNALWFADIASASLKYRGIQPAAPLSLSRAAADFVVAILVEVVFVVQSMLMVHLPIPLVAPLMNFFHLSLLHALYSFEYFWMSRGFELKSRLAKIERCWPYFLGFGSLLTILTIISDNFVVSGCLFGMFFPFFIISGYMADIKVLSEESPSVPTIHIFWPSVIITNRIASYIYRLAGVGQMSGRLSQQTSVARQQQQSRFYDRSASPVHLTIRHRESASSSRRLTE